MVSQLSMRWKKGSKQGCFIRSFKVFNTVKYVLNTQYTYNTILFSGNSRSADF
jgi:hypothetical protein